MNFEHENNEYFSLFYSSKFLFEWRSFRAQSLFSCITSNKRAIEYLIDSLYLIRKIFTKPLYLRPKCISYHFIWLHWLLIIHFLKICVKFSLRLKVIGITFYHDFVMSVDNLTIALIIAQTPTKRDTRLWTSNFIVFSCTNQIKMFHIFTECENWMWIFTKALELWVISHSLLSSFVRFQFDFIVSVIQILHTHAP